MVARVLLCISGIDSSGGAGLAADVRTAAALGVHSACVPSVNTAQTSARVEACQQLDVALFDHQLRISLELHIGAIKIGILSERQIPVTIDFIRRSSAPAVLDPVIAATSGFTFQPNPAVYLELLRNCIVTPNDDEFSILNDVSGGRLVDVAQAVVVTDARRAGSYGVRLFDNGTDRFYPYVRTEGVYHGSGCVFSTALAAALCLGQTVEDACQSALGVAKDAIANAYVIDDGQAIPQPLPQ